MIQMERNYVRFFNGRVILSLFLLTVTLMLIVNLLDLPGTVPHIKELSGGVGILDTQLYYSAKDLYSFIHNQHVEGRNAYYHFLISFDAFFPILYSIALSLSIQYIFRKVFPNTTKIRKLAFIPILAGFFDYLENASLLLILAHYPTQMDQIATIAGYFTFTKWMLSFITLLIIVIGLVLLMVINIRRQGR